MSVKKALIILVIIYFVVFVLFGVFYISKKKKEITINEKSLDSSVKNVKENINQIPEELMTAEEKRQEILRRLESLKNQNDEYLDDDLNESLNNPVVDDESISVEEKREEILNKLKMLEDKNEEYVESEEMIDAEVILPEDIDRIVKDDSVPSPEEDFETPPEEPVFVQNSDEMLIEQKQQEILDKLKMLETQNSEYLEDEEIMDNVIIEDLE